jgi:hypothetical protein
MKLDVFKMFASNPLEGAQALGNKDGRLGQQHIEHLIVQEQGLEPVFSPAISTRHAVLLEESDPTFLESCSRDLRATEDALVTHLPRWFLVLLLGVVFVIEAETGVLFWKDEGLTGVPRLVMACATAATTIFLPWALLTIAKPLLASDASTESKS